MKKIICQECNLEFSCAENLSKHVKHHNLSSKEYYDRYLKKKGEGKCLICNKETIFKGIQKGYPKCCSLECSAKNNGKNRSKKHIIKKRQIEESFIFECKECHKKFRTSLSLNKHIIKFHDKKEYYDRFLKNENEGYCKICHSLTNFTGRLIGKYSGYELCCSKECREKYRLIERSKTNLIKYGVENVFQSKKVQQKIKDSCLEKYGVENNMQSEKGKDEYKLSMNKKYGVNWPTQNKESLEKGQKSAKTLRKFRDTEIWYQGTYELDFLNKYYDKYSDIRRGPSIKYIYNGKNKIYHPDFYIPSLNLVIEIKSTWILNRDIEIEEKKKATITNGFKYIMIIDKDYSNLWFNIP
jgi:hypothetical protein